MSNFLNLPKLLEGKLTPGERGEWSDPKNAPGSLADLVAAINVGVDDDKRRDMPLRNIKSVPHAWAHVIVFETAFNDEKHSGHKDAVGQWRALLALLALRNKNRPVTTESVSLKDKMGRLENNNDKKAAAFLKVLSDELLVPKISDKSWRTIHLIYTTGDGGPNARADELLLGMLSPSTIVAPARNFQENATLKQAWAKSGLIDPLDLEGDDALSADELEICRLFVKKLQEALPGGDLGKITKHLADYEKDLLKGHRSDQNETMWGAKDHIGKWKERREGDLVDDKDAGGLYEALNYVWVNQIGDSDNATTNLAIGKVKVGDKEIKMVLADPACANALKRPPQLISVFDDKTLADFPADLPPEDFDTLRQMAGGRGILLLRPDDLLSSHLTRLDGFRVSEGPNRERTHPKGFENMLLPIKPVVLLLFDEWRSELKERIYLGGTAANPRVTLKLRLSDQDGKNLGDHTISQVYRDHPKGQAPVDAGCLQKAFPPSALAAWPDFKDNEKDKKEYWRWNYLYACGPAAYQSRSVVVTTGVSRECLERDISSRPTAGDVGVRLGKWASPDGPWEKKSGKMSTNLKIGDKDKTSSWLEWLYMEEGAATDVRERTLMRANWAFDAVLFRLPGEFDSVYAGLGILPCAEDVARGNGKVKIACDFGTSNTIVYTKLGDQGATPALLEPRLRRFNGFIDDDGDTVDSDGDYAFMPVKLVEQPFATVMQRRNVARGRDLVNEWSTTDKPPLWLDYAFFDPDVLSLTENILGSGSGDLVFNLKFDDEEGRDSKDKTEKRNQMQRYLQHIAILSLADVIGDNKGNAPSEIEWRFSYPMSMKDLSAYTSVIKKCVDKEHQEKVQFLTESRAALNYFKGYEKSGGIFVVLDIGGGSTDIAIGTKDEELVWQNSIRLAGEELMTNFLLYNRSLLGILRLDHVGSGGVFGDRRSRQAFLYPATDRRPSLADRNAARTIINSALFGDTFHREFGLISHTDEMRLLRVGGSLMMGGLCSFVGEQIKAQLKHDPSVFTKSELQHIALCFAGKGSTLLKEWEEDQVFKGMTSYLAEAEWESDTTTRFSEKMKHEAAKGMLPDEEEGRGWGKLENDKKWDLVVGIAAEVPGSEDLNAGSYRKEVPIDVTLEVKKDEFDSFMKKVGGQVGFEIKLKKAAEVSIVRAGAKAFEKLAEDNKKRRGTVADPPFIAMLKELMELVYEGKQVEVEWW